MSNTMTLTAEPGTSIIQIERIFDAPRNKVFLTFTHKEKLEKWWSPNGEAHIKIDAREGGAWKFTDVMSDGQKITFYGIFHEVTSPERIVQTAEFANVGERGHVVLEKYEFTELDDKRTRLLLTEVFMSVEDRDAAIESGMEGGLAQSYDNLENILQETK
jgi:uncharacterized protein YndB with AHSA1/START domain